MSDTVQCSRQCTLEFFPRATSSKSTLFASKRFTAPSKQQITVILDTETSHIYREHVRVSIAIILLQHHHHHQQDFYCGLNNEVTAKSTTECKLGMSYN